MKLSKYQNDIINELKKGFYIWTNEGENYKAWLGDDKGVVIKYIRVRTAEILFNKNIIKYINGDYGRGLFKYRLT